MAEEKLSEVPQLLTPKEAAEMLGVSTRTLAQWRKAGRHLSWIHLGGQVRYRLSTIQEFMEHGTPTPRPGGLDGSRVQKGNESDHS
jgi:excisionase family DNA binding protein